MSNVNNSFSIESKQNDYALFLIYIDLPWI
jgi:hypothetical protein